MQQRRDPKFGVLVAITYGLVAFTTLMAVATYFYYRAEMKQGDQAARVCSYRMTVALATAGAGRCSRACGAN